MTDPAFDTSVVVVGAGQAGLSVAYYLRRLGLDPGNDFVILDRGPSTGGAWQFRWEALRLGYAHRVNDLPGMAELDLSFDTADRHAPAKDVVADYYAQYEQHFGLQVVRPANVTRVEGLMDGFTVTFDDSSARHGGSAAATAGLTTQRVTTRVLVNATGTWGAPFIPWYPGLDSFRGRMVHTSEYRDASEFAGMRVAIVGGGTSAIGFLMELEKVAAETTWFSRRPIEFLEEQELNIESGSSSVRQQDEAARQGRALPSIVSTTGVPRSRRIQAAIDRGLLLAQPMFTRVTPNGVVLPDGREVEVDAIIWATGFRPELRHLAPLKLREKSGGITVGQGASWRNSRVFFAGYGPAASTIGANRAGRTIARQVIATLSSFG
ncbi:NAD(P)-binding domain-containing protein [Schumannella luteola]|uniref:Cation diffusion facilitator CzcD-associated flavoprotein CzcO n=1 Tax=Schumannella luteola TaxID=472059 RepID=A0A852YM44_9MICO|nr:cation diffusion facilitator CzcD-associated flavoprotein CzcO [Schumannella luteola]TPX05730.1 NAD(P)/FAD-dependent oxidoreductase [Schumannella luteola]